LLAVPSRLGVLLDPDDMFSNRTAG